MMTSEMHCKVTDVDLSRDWFHFNKYINTLQI